MLNFYASGPNQKWAGEITYLRTDEGWLYRLPSFVRFRILLRSACATADRISTGYAGLSVQLNIVTLFSFSVRIYAARRHSKTGTSIKLALKMLLFYP
jgi:transposase InsO family protein